MDILGWLEISDGMCLGLVPCYEQETVQLIDGVCNSLSFSSSTFQLHNNNDLLLRIMLFRSRGHFSFTIKMFIIACLPIAVLDTAWRAWNER